MRKRMSYKDLLKGLMTFFNCHNPKAIEEKVAEYLSKGIYTYSEDNVLQGRWFVIREN